MFDYPMIEFWLCCSAAMILAYAFDNETDASIGWRVLIVITAPLVIFVVLCIAVACLVGFCLRFTTGKKPTDV